MDMQLNDPLGWYRNQIVSAFDWTYNYNSTKPFFPLWIGPLAPPSYLIPPSIRSPMHCRRWIMNRILAKVIGVMLDDPELIMYEMWAPGTGNFGILSPSQVSSVSFCYRAWEA